MHYIFLNGASSSRKTEIAHALQKTLKEPILYPGVDVVIEMRDVSEVRNRALQMELNIYRSNKAD